MGNCCFCLKPIYNKSSHPKEEEEGKEKIEQSASATTVPSNKLLQQISRDQVDSHHQQECSHNDGKVSHDHKNGGNKNVVRLRIVMTQQELDEFLSKCRSNNKNKKLMINTTTTIVQMNAKMNSNKVNNNNSNITTINSSSSSWRPNLESIPE